MAFRLNKKQIVKEIVKSGKDAPKHDEESS
jgi:hypothetical protein